MQLVFVFTEQLGSGSFDFVGIVVSNAILLPLPFILMI